MVYDPYIRINFKNIAYEKYLKIIIHYKIHSELKLHPSLIFRYSKHVNEIG